MTRVLRLLLLLLIGLASFAGVVFALPVVITGYVLAATMLLSPALWVAGASYAKGGRQAFFAGGVVCGILPFVVGFGCLLLMTMQTQFTPVFSPVTTTSTFTVPTTPPTDAVPTNPFEQPPPPNASSPESPGPTAVTPIDDAADASLYASVPTNSPVLVSRTVAYPVSDVLGRKPYWDTLADRLTFAGIWLAPGIAALLGGCLSLLTYYLLRPASAAAKPSLSSGETGAIAGRLTTVPMQVEPANSPSS